MLALAFVFPPFLSDMPFSFGTQTRTHRNKNTETNASSYPLLLFCGDFTSKISSHSHTHTHTDTNTNTNTRLWYSLHDSFLVFLLILLLPHSINYNKYWNAIKAAKKLKMLGKAATLTQTYVTPTVAYTPKKLMPSLRLGITVVLDKHTLTHTRTHTFK